MLKRHSQRPIAATQTRPNLALALRPAAAAVAATPRRSSVPAAPSPRLVCSPVVSGLALPAFAPAIPGRFAINLSATSHLTNAARTLAEMGVLRPEHWRGNPSEAISVAFTDLAKEHLPEPLADWNLQFVDDTAKDNNDSLDWKNGSHGYQTHHKLPDDTQVGAIILMFDVDATVHRVIGPTIENLESIKPGLGQSVLYWLHEAFNLSYRALDPIDAYGWAQHQYWMGEMDEGMRLEEDMDYARQEHELTQKGLPKSKRTPFDAVAARKQIELFTKADFDAKIPPWAGTKFAYRPKLSLAIIEETLIAASRQSAANKPEALDLLTALLQVARIIKRRRTRRRSTWLNDIHLFERTRQEMSPYIIRWKCNRTRTDQDAIAQIYDDAMNECFQSGEKLLDVNAVFAWHDLGLGKGESSSSSSSSSSKPGTLANAVKRFIQFLDLARAADALLLTISTDPDRQERVRITV